MAYEHISSEAVLKGKVRKEFAWDIISDYTRYPSIMENVDRVEIHEKDDGAGRSEWFVTIEEAPLTWLERDYYDYDNHEIRFESIDGDFDNINGRWKVEDYNGAGVKIYFDVDYNLGIPVIEEVLGDILKEKMKSNMDQMVTAIKNELTAKQTDERKYERYDIGKYNTIELNERKIRTYIVNVSQKGMMFYYDGEFVDSEMRLIVGDLVIEAEELYNDLKHKNTRIIFKEALGAEKLNRMIELLKTKNVRFQERKLIDKDVTIVMGNRNVSIHLINISHNGMSFSYKKLSEGFSDIFELNGALVSARDVYHDVKNKTMRVVFSKPLSDDDYNRFLQRIEELDAVTQQLQLPL